MVLINVGRNRAVPFGEVSWQRKSWGRSAQMLCSEWTHTENHRTPPLDLSVVRKQKATEKRCFIWLYRVLWMQLFSSCFTTIRHNSFRITHFKPVSPGIKYQVFPMSCSRLDHPITHKHCFGLHGYSGDSGVFLPHHWLPRIHGIIK